MQMIRRVLLMVAVLLVPALLAVAGTMLAAPAGPPQVDSRTVEMGAGPDGKPAPGLEPAPTPDPVPPQAPAPPAPEPPLPAAPEAPAVPPQPVPVVPPVVIDDDDDDDVGDD